MISLKRYLHWAILSLFILCTNSTYAQTAFIQNIVVIPSQPTINDSIYAIITTSFSSGPCNQVTQYVTILGNSINVQSGHNLGPLTYICTSIDTVAIGFLSAGLYTLNANINASGAMASDSIQFVVINPTSVYDLHFNQVKLYPNPANECIKIESNSKNPIKQISIFDFSGREVLNTDVTLVSTEKEEILIDIADISNGIYYLQLSFKNEKIFKNLIIQH
ncbi:MAG: T9SS type A sorting domain-containing protein [Bacteroidia bacterium]|nr:T9SS type A sorting domain-containing protein [Bacteroidia bacterium]